MKGLILRAPAFLFVLPTNAQFYKETFGTNSLEWTECAYKNAVGTAVIDRGAMTITSKGELKGSGLLAGKKIRENTFFETHCYAPIDVMRPFEIAAKVNIKQLASDRLAGPVFNYRDNGNFYCFSFNDDFVTFRRFENGDIVGEVSQGIKWSQKRREETDWTLTSDGDTLIFKINGASILTIRYMPLSYTGVGFYTYGNQELIVDEIEFRQ